MRKIVYMLSLACCLLCAQSTTVLAAGNNTILDVETAVPYMEYIMDASSDIHLNTNTGYATANCSVVGYQNITTKVSIDMELQQLINGRWITIKDFSISNNSYYANTSESYKVSKGYSYRVKATIKAYCNTLMESKTVTSSETKY